MMQVGVQQTGVVTRWQGEQPQLAWAEQHTDFGGLGQAVPDSGLLAVTAVVSERAAFECGL